MAKKQPQHAKGENDELMMVVGIIGVLIFLWFALHHKIAALVLGVRDLEAAVIGLFTDTLVPLRRWIAVIDRKAVTAGDMWQVSTMVGQYTKWLSAPILIGLGIWLNRRSPTERFRRTFTDATLPQQVADQYPWMRISVKMDFTKKDVSKGNWALAKSERQFVKEHRLRGSNGELDRDKTESIFAKQMGPLLLGFRAMKPHVRILFVMFALRIARQFTEGDSFLMRTARDASDGKLDVTEADRLAPALLVHDEITRLMLRHAYERTLLMSMLEKARGGPRGKEYLPPNWFLWLKGVDRTLWYALSDVGRTTTHVECAGLWGHWLAEREIGKRLEVPFTRNAVDGLAIELAKYLNDDDVELDGLSPSDPDRDIPRPPEPNDKVPAAPGGPGSGAAKDARA